MDFQYDPSFYTLLPEAGFFGESDTLSASFEPHPEAGLVGILGPKQTIFGAQPDDFIGFDFPPFDMPNYGLLEGHGSCGVAAVRPALPWQSPSGLLDVPLSPHAQPIVPPTRNTKLPRHQQLWKSLPASHFIVDGRPAPPAELTPHLNPSHIPYSHGRCPDRHGLKDTTVANDYYYTLTTPQSFTLPRSGKEITYRGPEFDKGIRFNGRELVEYLSVCPRRPILRIQFQPAQYNHRYMRGGASFKCRLESCPSKTATILKGQPRVALHEFEDENGDWLNPYATAAGYVHLYCLEQALNFPQLCQQPDFTVVPETRKLAHEPVHRFNPRVNNPMALNEDELLVLREWRQELGSRWTDFCAIYPDAEKRPLWNLENKDRLFHRLAVAHVDGNAQYMRNAQKRKREAAVSGAASAHLADFCGDVSKQINMQKKVLETNHKLREAVATKEDRSAKKMRVEPPPPEPVLAHASPAPSRDFTGTDMFLPMGFEDFQFPQDFQAPVGMLSNEYSIFPLEAQTPPPLFTDVLNQTTLEPFETQQQPATSRRPRTSRDMSPVSPKSKVNGKSCVSRRSSTPGEATNLATSPTRAQDPVEVGGMDAQAEGGARSPVWTPYAEPSSNLPAAPSSPATKQASNGRLEEATMAAFAPEREKDSKDRQEMYISVPSLSPENQASDVALIAVPDEVFYEDGDDKDSLFGDIE